jgi:glutamate N-acetyltransferase/amino-acid N-acetyltransferase
MAPLPKGFLLATEEAAIKKPGRKDLLLIYSEAEAAMAGVFTTNKVKGAPVRLCIGRIRSGRGRAIISNSGNANVCTGRRGMRDAREMAGIVARGLSVDERLVHVCSTGVIGAPLPMERIRPKLEGISADLGRAGLEEAARAIMTTDTFPKLASKTLRISGKTVRIAAVAKGAGMIHPKMATMLCFIMTDAAVGKGLLKRLLKDAADRTFNRLTVDGDTSTSDTALLMANGLAGNAPVVAGSKDAARFGRALHDICHELARMIARDGEGATKLVEVEVRGAKSAKDAARGAFAVANSLLVKTALYGNDSNWGRIMAALGSSGIAMDEEKTDIYIGKVKIAGRGRATGKDALAGEVLKRSKEVRLSVNLGLGDASDRVLTCDLSEEYVRINAEYRT